MADGWESDVPVVFDLFTTIVITVTAMPIAQSQSNVMACRITMIPVIENMLLLELHILVIFQFSEVHLKTDLIPV